MTSRSKIDPVYAEHHAPEFDDGMDACQAAFNEETARRKKLRGEK